MKKQDMIKTLHLAVLLILSSICLFLVFTDTALSHEIAINPKVKLVFSLIWITLGISFLFLFLDFLFLRNYKKDFHQLHHAAHSDSMTGIANRYSCDGIIQKYYDSILPDYLGCIMLEITNLSDINHLKGRRHGDMLLREFAKILDHCSKNLCFVGRNGGNKFLAIFEQVESHSFSLFLEQLAQEISLHNQKHPQLAIQYSYGTSFQHQDEVTTIMQLIALANRRISEE